MARNACTSRGETLFGSYFSFFSLSRKFAELRVSNAPLLGLPGGVAMVCQIYVPPRRTAMIDDLRKGILRTPSPFGAVKRKTAD